MKPAFIFVLIATLAGCGSVKPLPQDTYLRVTLPALASEAPAQVWTTGELHVAAVANGLFHERAVVYSKDNGKSLFRHRYLFWISAPELMVERTLVDYLQASKVAAQVVGESSVRSTLEVAASITRFEQLISDEGVAMQAEIAFRVRAEPDGRSLFYHTYGAREPVTDATATAAATAMSRAIANVYLQFAADASAALHPDLARE